MGDVQQPDISTAAITFAHHRLSSETEDADKEAQAHDCMVLVAHRFGTHELETAATVSLRDCASPSAAGAQAHYEAAFAVIGVVAAAEMVHGVVDVQSDLCTQTVSPDAKRQCFTGVVKRDRSATTCQMVALCHTDCDIAVSSAGAPLLPPSLG